MLQGRCISCILNLLYVQGLAPKECAADLEDLRQAVQEMRAHLEASPWQLLQLLQRRASHIEASTSGQALPGLSRAQRLAQGLQEAADVRKLRDWLPPKAQLGSHTSHQLKDSIASSADREAQLTQVYCLFALSFLAIISCIYTLLKPHRCSWLSEWC